jgi:AraC family transcriptional regulator, regulatory protein of adaptative response / methylated-DNA-[protein]-cysteine methyltransferase
MSTYTTQAAVLTVRYGFHATPFGEALIAMTERGVCALSFVDHGGRAGALESLGGEYRGARLIEDTDGTRHTMACVFSGALGAGAEVSVDVKGTTFQRRVWEALRNVPRGTVMSYEDIARTIGRPRATRAVGSAIGANPAAVVIPCHRVIRKSGDLGGYRWGLERKRQILSWEGRGS